MFHDAAGAAVCPFAQSLFRLPGVSAVFLAEEFLSVTKAPETDWMVLKPLLLGAIMDYFMAHDHVALTTDAVSTNDTTDTTDSQVVREIKDLLEQRIRPAVAQDGGNIVFDRFEHGVVYIKFEGACAGCPSSSATLKSGVENMLRHYIPEVTEVRAI